MEPLVMGLSLLCLFLGGGLDDADRLIDSSSDIWTSFLVGDPDDMPIVSFEYLNNYLDFTCSFLSALAQACALLVGMLSLPVGPLLGRYKSLSLSPTCFVGIMPSSKQRRLHIEFVLEDFSEVNFFALLVIFWSTTSGQFMN